MAHHQHCSSSPNISKLFPNKLCLQTTSKRHVCRYSLNPLRIQSDSFFYNKNVYLFCVIIWRVNRKLLKMVPRTTLSLANSCIFDSALVFYLSRLRLSIFLADFRVIFMAIAGEERTTSNSCSAIIKMKLNERRMENHLDIMVCCYTVC